MTHDVVVLGATVAGLTAARRLAAEGFDVLVMDPNPEARSAAIGHGVAAMGHASTVANMAHAYGLDAAREHIERNLAALDEIRSIHDHVETVRLRDRSLPGGDEGETRRLAELYRSLGGTATVLTAPGGCTLATDALIVDPTAYAMNLRAAAVSAGANVVHGVTVTHLNRREGVTVVGFRNNVAWARELGSLKGVSIIDTMGVSPWGRAARIGPAQWVPVVRCTPSRPVRDVSLQATGPAWLIRPIGGEALVLGQKTSLGRVEAECEGLGEWVRSEMGADDVEVGRLAIDPSDHGRPVVGASAIPGGYYARGNGRGELMNGTASGYFLADLLMGSQGSTHALPPYSKLRALSSRLTRRR